MRIFIIKWILCIGLLLDVGCIHGQSTRYFQQDVAYDFDVNILSLNKLNVELSLDYRNNSKNNLDTIYFHFWMNAFSNKQSPYAQQILKGGDRSFYFYKPSDLGGYNKIETTIQGKKIQLNFEDLSKEIGYVVLDSPLKPKDNLTISFNYELTLPKMSGRIGWDNDMAKVIHWFPRVVVYDQDGWHKMPYLSWGEFYGEYSDFEIKVSGPDSLNIISANGALQSSTSLNQVIDAPLVIYKSGVTVEQSNYSDIPIYSFYNHNSDEWQHSIEYAIEVLKYFEKEIGPFPFSSLTICQGPLYQGGAMEYPGMVIINGSSTKRQLHYLLAHEIAHQYFYGALGFNERKEPYMDEGLATFYEDKFTKFKYGSSYYDQSVPPFARNLDNISLGQKSYIHQCGIHMHQPMDLKVEDLTAINYGLNSYPKASHMWQLIESYIGKKEFRRSIREIYLNHKESHLNHKTFMSYLRKASGLPLDFVYAITSGESLDLNFINKNGKIFISSEYTTPLPILSRVNNKDTCFILKGGLHPLDEDLINNQITLDPYYLYNDTNRKNNLLNKSHPLKIHWLGSIDNINNTDINVVPLVHINTTNKISPGFAVYNSTFPSKKLQWMLNPGYSFKTNSLIGQTWIKYKWRPFNNKSSALIPYLGLKTYSFQNNELFNYDLAYQRTKLGLSFVNHTSDKPKKISKFALNWTHINEERAFFSGPNDFSKRDLKVNRLQFRIEHKNNHSLSPNAFKLSLDYVPSYNENENFVNLSSSIKQKFYYNRNKSFDIRLWASYFLTNSQRNSLSYNNQLVRGSTGLIYTSANDYMYDYYYFDRDDGSFNQSNGDLGGGFKTIFSNSYNIGQTNDMAFSANIMSDIPVTFLSGIPLKLYYDIGGYSTYVDNKRNVKYLYSGGLSLSALSNALQINLPLINSKEINQIYRQEGGSFISRVSFTIDFLKLNPWEFIDKINYYF